MYCNCLSKIHRESFQSLTVSPPAALHSGLLTSGSSWKPHTQQEPLRSTVFSSSWRDRGFSNSLAVVFETFLYQERFLWGNANIAKHHEIAFSSPKQQRASHNAVFFLSPRRAPEDCGTLWRKPGLSLDLGSYSWLRSGTHWHGMSHLQNNSLPWHKLEEWHCQVVTLCIVERGRRYMTRSWTQQMRTGWEEWEQDGAEPGLDRRGQDSTC